MTRSAAPRSTNRGQSSSAKRLDSRLRQHFCPCPSMQKPRRYATHELADDAFSLIRGVNVTQGTSSQNSQ
jgi:hypothetical protein